MKQFEILELDRPRKFRFGMRALRMIEERVNKTIFSLFTEIGQQNISMKDLLVLCWAGLLYDDPELTLEQVEALIDDSNLNLTDLLEKIGRAINIAFKGEEEEEKKEIKEIQV